MEIENGKRTPFGAQSEYYQLYKESPSKARKRLWEVFQQCEGQIQTTARRMGCSRDTVRRVARRCRVEGPVFWDNRPTRPFEPRPSHVGPSVRKLVEKLSKRLESRAAVSGLLRDRYGIVLPPKVLTRAGL